MGITALYPKKRPSEPHPGDKVYPYLLRGMNIDRSGQVRCVDITCIPMSQDFMYLAAAMDWPFRLFGQSGRGAAW